MTITAHFCEINLELVQNVLLVNNICLFLFTKIGFSVFECALLYTLRLFFFVKQGDFSTEKHFKTFLMEIQKPGFEHEKNS